MRPILGPALMTGALLAFVAVLAGESLTLSRPARLVPLAVILPTLALLALQLSLDVLRTGRKPDPEEPTYRFAWVRNRVRAALLAQPPGEQPPAGRPAELAVFSWILAVPALTWLLGVALAVPAFTLLYLRLAARERWTLALPLTALIAAFPFAIAQLGLAGRLYDGALWRWLGA